MFEPERVAISPTSPGGNLLPLASRMASSTPGSALPAERIRSSPSMWSSGGSATMVPVVSVIPYICTKPQPNTSMHSFRSDGGNRGGAVEHVFQPGKIYLSRPWLAHHE